MQNCNSLTNTTQKCNTYKVKQNKIENGNNLANGQKVNAGKHRQQALASCTPTIQKYNTYKVNAKQNKIENKNNLAKGQNTMHAK